MGNLRATAQAVKQAFDRIQQAKANPQQLEQAITDAKAKVDQLVQEADQN